MLNKWGVQYVIESLAFEKHLERMREVRKRLENMGIPEKCIKIVLMDRSWFKHYWQVEVIDGETRGSLPNRGQK